MEKHFLEEQVRELKMGLELEKEQKEKLQQRIAELEKTVQELREENRILKAKIEVALKLMTLALEFDAIGKTYSKGKAFSV
ncbi:hypothetical protein MTAT_26550 [Moorella thermoacetica]|uniref:Uncharacterized protein n=2 Tax=Neomoorella thermoacetica TaxID=1525 RepID=A0AAC9MTY8_NEOTH|nr:hypothetical protein [Moorella thermoacetica]AOQ23042.1 hypothetical protein Maut_00579 [Moorella thermoacetica]TYL08991.1 hypothetical protein MTAT_26550 [Moorella thermoacetica]